MNIPGRRPVTDKALAKAGGCRPNCCLSRSRGMIEIYVAIRLARTVLDVGWTKLTLALPLFSLS